MEIEKIYSGEKMLAWILRKDKHPLGKEFPSNKEDSLQVGCMFLPSGEKIVPHIHKIKSRNIIKTQEVIYLIRGVLRVDFFNENKLKISEKTLFGGDLIALLDGGHGFESLEDTQIFEVKQGPYINVEEDKEKFYPEDKK